MLRATIYARFSSDKQDKITIQTQISDCKKKAESLGFEVVSEYSDEGFTGRTDKRPGFQKMLAEASLSPKPFDVIFVRDLSRFARNADDAAFYKAVLKKKGIRVCGSLEEIAIDSPTGALIERILDWQNDYFSQQLSLKAQSSIRNYGTKGNWLGGEAPYGFKIERKGNNGQERSILVPDEKEAEIVRIVFKMYSEGISYPKIIAEIVKRGAKPRRSTKWWDSALSMMLDKPVYAGDLVWKLKTGEVIVSKNAVEPLIDQQTLEIARKRREENREFYIKPQSGCPRPLSGLLRCGECGSLFSVYGQCCGKFKYVCSKHRKKLGCENKRYVDELALVAEIKKCLNEICLDPDKLKKSFKEYRSKIASTGENLETEQKGLSQKIQNIDLKIKKWFEKCEEDSISWDIVKPRIQALNDEKVQIAERVRETERKKGVSVSIQDSMEDVKGFCAKVSNSLEKLDGLEFKEQMKRLGLVVVIPPDGEVAKLQLSPNLNSQGNPNANSGNFKGSGSPAQTRGTGRSRRRRTFRSRAATRDSRSRPSACPPPAREGCFKRPSFPTADEKRLPPR
jgi:DNA invertase Pin-like site-specific DNA recombinase